ncbi:MAG: SUMF1/EgtB/PvdO family nonheme iron enzyme [Polyangiaceae bacterium]|nr:SUMF1/EgtB/PvdO family nonheme iron enzyme [Polyangiaceae bacterium]
MDDAECWTDICHDMTCRVSDGSPCDESNECKSGKCDIVCLTSDGATCTDDTKCASGVCNNGTCKVSHGNTCAADMECASGLCAGMACVAQSCIGLTSTCGPGGDEYCCASPVVTGGQYNRSNNPDAPATVDDFRLDRFEVTVGRFRKFVDAYPGSRPDLDAGQHPTIAGSAWNAAWDTYLPATQAALTDALANCSYPTWSANAGANDELPINCVDWYVAFAFCAWDGGRLPTEAEWNYAAAGGNEQRIYPWSDPPSSSMIDASYTVYDCAADGNQAACEIGDIAFVGWTSPKGDGRFGHADLAGSVMEWTLDWYNTPYSPSCSNCANLSPSMDRVLRGGSWFRGPIELQTFARAYSTPDLKDPNDYPSDEIGFRCARNVP